MHAYSGHPCTVVALKLSPLLLVRPGELQALTGHGRYVFGTSAKADRPMSENTVNKALQAMGYRQRTDRPRLSGQRPHHHGRGAKRAR